MSAAHGSTRTVLLLVAVMLLPAQLAPQQDTADMPDVPLTFGAFTAMFRSDGTFSIEGEGWPPFSGTWKVEGEELRLQGPSETELENCDGPGRYAHRNDGGVLRLSEVADDCMFRRMVLDRSFWSPADRPADIPSRQILVSRSDRPRDLPRAAPPDGSWPSFRGPGASGVAEKQNLPDTWNGETGENILWRTEIPGLAHSSPVVWGDRVFVTSAVSSRGGAIFRPGLYGDGDASEDLSIHQWTLTALDKRSGQVLWTRIAHEGPPIDKRHIKSTYANSTPATDGRVVVAAFGSQGVYAYDIDGDFLWRADLGRLNLGAYDVPSYEWGPASSPILWDGLVILQCDTQADSFVTALDAETGDVVWRTDRDELPTWGTPTVVPAKTGPELVTNGANFIRGYDPRSGEELWRLGRSSKITAPTPIFSDGLIVVSSGRGPERPIFVLRPGARGDLTLAAGQVRSDAVVWSIEKRGPYMPSPIAYDGFLYVLANNGVFDAYDLATGREIYRQRLNHRGSGFSGSPVAADGKLYLPSEDGDILVVAAGPEFREIAVNSMGETLMTAPALSEGVMYVRAARSLFAIGRPAVGSAVEPR